MKKLYRAKFDVRRGKRGILNIDNQSYELLLVAKSKEDVIDTIEAMSSFSGATLIFKSIKKAKMLGEDMVVNKPKKKKKKDHKKKLGKNPYGLDLYGF